jgi:hypothetical protein
MGESVNYFHAHYWPGLFWGPYFAEGEGEPEEEKIIVTLELLRNLETTLRGIATAGGYNTNIGEVAIGRSNPLEIERLPCALIIPEHQERPTYLFTDVIQRPLQLILRLWVGAEKNIAYALEDFIRDVQKAMAADHTRGGSALNTLEVGLDYLADDIKLVNRGADISYEIVFQRGI